MRSAIFPAPPDASRPGAESERALKALHDYFDRIYVVSIERNAVRRELLARDLGGLRYTCISGIDGMLLAEAEVLASYDDEAARVTYGRSLSRGQLGCALSHRMIYQEVVEQQLERVLILEDDAVPCWANLPLIDSVLVQLPADWDFLYMFTDRPEETRRQQLKLRWIYPLVNCTGVAHYPMHSIRRAYSHKYSPNLRTAGRHWYAVAYAITARTARRMLEIQTPIRTVADDVTRMICATDGVKAFLSVPNIFAPRPNIDSSIWNRPAKKAF